MILYQLGCSNDHRFESWFRDSVAFDEQVKRGLLACPVCGVCAVTKSIMAPAVFGASARREVIEAAPVAVSPGESPLLDPRRRAMRAALGDLREKILSGGQDVGARFPDEARRMHDGGIPFRPIHGRATPDEARGLIEDGIMILPIPELPEGLN